MADVNSLLCENSIKCMTLLHRLLGAWLVFCLVAVFLPAGSSSTKFKLPFTDLNVPVDSARWTCAVVIFFIGFAGCAIVKQLRELCVRLERTEHIAVVLTFPSAATLGTPWQRMLFGYGLAFVQHSVGYALWAPMPQMFGGSPDIGLAFAYSGPMFWLAWDLRDWQKGLSPKMDFPKIIETNRKN